jgi:glycosyltransferase involved in cell wall biosynthesis
LRRPALQVKDLKRLFQKGMSMFRRASASDQPQSGGSAFPVIAPRVFPLPRSRIGRWLNRVLLQRQVRRHLDPATEVWVWASLPSAIDFRGAFGETRWFYYCGDDFGGLAGVDHATVQARETQLLEHADWTFAASEALQQRFANYPSSVLSHGVHLWQYEHVSQPLPSPQSGKKTLGFYGAIADWIDQTLLIALARCLREWEIVMIGPQLVNVQALLDEPNIRLLPAQPHERLPSYLAQWDAAILPFIDNDQIRACNPLKLREYLASGTPVLSSPFPALQPYREYVHEITSVEAAVEWLQCLEAWDNPERRAARKAAVAHESWEARAQTVAAQLRSFEQEQPSPQTGLTSVLSS